MPILNHTLLTRLLGSIEANHLVILCGAGLSIPDPSNLMSADRVAKACYDKWTATQALPTNLRDDIESLAAHFYAQGQFVSVFIGALVPWNELVGEPNEGHAAVSDLLISRAANAALSANFDPLVEQWAERRKIAMQGALDGAEALAFADRTNPLLKFHGCLHRRREQTLWTQRQLPEQEIQQRIASCAAWMGLNLPGKDLLIVGFWSDWGYLNDVLAQAIAINGIASVTVIDPATTAQLQAKAPTLWNRLTGTVAPFQHVQASGSEALEELRVEFSKVWARKVFSPRQTAHRNCRGQLPGSGGVPFMAARGYLQLSPRWRRRAVQSGCAKQGARRRGGAGGPRPHSADSSQCGTSGCLVSTRRHNGPGCARRGTGTSHGPGALQ